MKRHLLLLLFVLHAAALRAEDLLNFQEDGHFIQIGTFNIKYLGDPKQGRTEDDLKSIAAIIAEKLDLEVFVLQEIDVASADYKTLTDLLRKHGYQFIEGSTGGVQRVVIGWDKDEVTQVGQAGEVGEQLKDTCVKGQPNKILRSPLRADFKAGNFKFTLVGTHLKSQLGDEEEQKCGDKLRAKQCEIILSELAKDAGASKVILAGDFNSGNGDASLKPLRDAGYVSLTEPAARHPGSKTAHSYIGSYGHESIDHLMIKPGEVPEWIPGSTYYFQPEKLDSYVEDISDHAPVLSSFVIDK